MRDLSITERVEAYLDGRLTAEEHNVFREELKSNPDLQAGLEQQKAAALVMDQALSLRWKKQMQGWAQEVAEVNTEPRVFSNRLFQKPWLYYAAAACIVLLLMLPWTYNKILSPQADLAELYAEYHEVPNLSVPRGEAEESWSEIARFYGSGEYEAAIPGLAKLAAGMAEQENNKARYYLGQCYLEMGKTENALEMFTQVSVQSSYYPDAQWAMVLSYLRLNNKQELKPAIEAILAQPNHYAKSRAEEIKNRLWE